MIQVFRRGKEAAGMALSDDLRTRVVEAVIERGLSRNAAAERFGVSVASAVRWVKRFETTGEIYPARTGGDRRSDRIEAHRDYLLGLSPRAGHDAAGDTGAPGRQLRRTFLFIRAVALFRSLQHHI
jgi:transposase-like protein